MKQPIHNRYRNFLKNISEYINSTYGLRCVDDKIKIRNSDFITDGDNVKIDEKSFPGTQGLYELLFMKKRKANFYTPQDIEKYTPIVSMTNVHKRNYAPNEQIKGNKSKFIIPNIPTSSSENITEKFTIFTTNKPKSYIYWDDANKLVDRLRFLVASQPAGNTTHSNEIILIIEELKESGIIS